MSKTMGLYFGGMDTEQVNALRARLNDLAGDLGYVARSGPTTGENRGVLARLLVGIDAGEVAVVKLPEAQRANAIICLSDFGEHWADAITEAFAAALTRQLEAALREIWAEAE